MRRPRKLLPTLIAAAALTVALPACGADDLGKETGKQLNDFGTGVGRGVLDEHKGLGKELAKPFKGEAKHLVE